MPYSVLIALGSNLGDRGLYLRRALDALGSEFRVVRLSRAQETEPVAAPPASPPFLNMVVVGHTALPPAALLDCLLAIERRFGRYRAGIRNAPRTIDLDLILHSAHLAHTPRLSLPHPRYRQREVVMGPARELGLRWPALTEG